MTQDTNTRQSGNTSRMKFSWQMIVVIILLALIIAFSAINTQKVNINLIFTKLDAPMIIIILCSFVIGVILTIIASWLHRRKKLKK